MQKISCKIQWKLLRRIGIGLILFAITSTLFSYYSYQSPYNAVLQVPRNNPTPNYQISMLLTQNNQFLDVKYTCDSCNKEINLSLTISRITSNDFSKEKTIYSFSFELVNQDVKDISMLLNPGSYILIMTLQGNYSTDLSISGFGVPYNFIITQIVIFITGTILFIIDFKKTDLIVFKKIISKIYSNKIPENK